uniref:Uncharacterized protein n=1 Tax=Manihot esculenta TaxID=3983 RepID=A0A199UCT6_MANES
MSITRGCPVMFGNQCFQPVLSHHFFRRWSSSNAES